MIKYIKYICYKKDLIFSNNHKKVIHKLLHVKIKGYLNLMKRKNFIFNIIYIFLLILNLIIIN